jgi:hypothetical protein
MFSKTCPECGEEFNSPYYNKKYCSESCKYHQYYRSRALPLPPKYSSKELDELERKSNENIISYFKDELQQINNDPTIAKNILKRGEYSKLIKNGVITKKIIGCHKGGVQAVLVYLTPESLKILTEIEEWR